MHESMTRSMPARQCHRAARVDGTVGQFVDHSRDRLEVLAGEELLGCSQAGLQRIREPALAQQGCHARDDRAPLLLDYVLMEADVGENLDPALETAHENQHAVSLTRREQLMLEEERLRVTAHRVIAPRGA